MMRNTLTAGALALPMLIGAQPAQAYYDGPWCAYERGGKGVISSRCDLQTYEACRAWMNASPGTWCTQNPRYQVAEKSPRRKARRIY
jgi:hypothetical protein